MKAAEIKYAKAKRKATHYGLCSVCGDVFYCPWKGAGTMECTLTKEKNNQEFFLSKKYK